MVSLKDERHYKFEMKVDRSVKLKWFDFSLKCSRPDIITVWIMNRILGQWKKIGKANIEITSKTTARWADIEIGSDREFIFGDVPNPDYQFRLLRGKGIGSKTVQHVLSYLRQHGIERVFGEISGVDDFDRASNFWKKNGFQVTRYAEPIGLSVAQVAKDFTLET